MDWIPTDHVRPSSDQTFTEFRPPCRRLLEIDEAVAPTGGETIPARVRDGVREDLNRLYNIVRHAQRTVLLCDGEGWLIEECGAVDTLVPAHPRLSELRSSPEDGSAPESSGSNGKRNCATRHRPGVSAAPICDVDGDLVATLDAPFFGAPPLDMTRGEDRMTSAVVGATARSIEERLFRDRYRGESILAVVPPDSSRTAMYFAIDRTQHVVAADRNGRAMLAERCGADAAARLVDRVSLWLLFEREPAAFRSQLGRDAPVLLVPVGTDERWPALITPPECASSLWGPADRNLHTRPRTDSIRGVRPLRSVPCARGGLSPGALRRVRAHIDLHLDADIDLQTLADQAGLSRSHFARAFKQSIGVSPQMYLVRCRLLRAQTLLLETDRSLAEIALETGFSDQSHFSRCFREHLDVSPSAFRRAMR
jgi:AraC-like DNA-binding protein